MKRLSQSIILMTLASGLLFGAIPSSARIIPLSSPLYEQVDALYRLSALALPSAARPWSSSEAKQIVEALDPSLPGFATLLALVSGGSEDLFSLKASLALTAEGYAHTNTTYNSPYLWAYSIDERRPLVRLTWEFALADRFYAAMGIDVATAHVTDDDTPLTGVQIGAFENDNRWLIEIGQQFAPHFVNNFPKGPPHVIAGDWPYASQISLAGPWWSASVGRGAVQWGSGVSGNLIIGNHIKNHNYVDFSFFGGGAKLQFRYLIQPNPLRDNQQRIFLGHRLEFSPWRWVRFAISENAMFKGETIILHYFDPTFFYHNLYHRNHLNSIAGIEIDLALARGLSFHGQVAIDQFQLPTEGDSEADAMGFLANLSYSWTENRGIYTLTLEGAYTDPALYRRDKVDFLILRGMENNSGLLYADYLGYRYGSDSITATARLSYQIPSTWRVAGSLALHSKGEVDLTTSHNKDGDNNEYANIPRPAPSGETVRYSVQMGLQGSWTPVFANLEFYASAHLITRLHYHRKTEVVTLADGDFQLAFGVSLTL